MSGNSVLTGRLGLLVSPLIITGTSRRASQCSADGCDILRISNLNTEWSVIDTHLESANATACSGTGKGFSPSGPSGSLAVSPGVTTTYTITCTGAGGAASQSVTVAVTGAAQLTIGMTVAATGTIYPSPTPSTNTSVIGVRGARQPRHGHWRSSQQHVHMVAGSLQRRPYWVDSLRAVSRPHHQQRRHFRSARVLVSIAPGASSTLSWSSTNATSCSGVRLLSIGRLRISLRLADCKHQLQHHLHR